MLVSLGWVAEDGLLAALSCGDYTPGEALLGKRRSSDRFSRPIPYLIHDI
jgi:hypothetical protein